MTDLSFDPFPSTDTRAHRGLETTRRNFMMLMGGFAWVAAAALGGLTSLKFMFPNATPETPAEYKVPNDPASITIDNPLMDYAHRVGIIRDAGGYYAVQLICTHLGCTPNYTSDVVSGGVAPESRALLRGDRTPADRIPNGWACPCHGSRYFIDSTNFYGPAPRPMDWVALSRSPDNRLLVNRADIVVMRNPGDTAPPTWRFDFDSGRVITISAAGLANT